MVSEIEAEAAERREGAGVQALGPAAILAQSSESSPLKPRDRPRRPSVRRAVRRELRNAYVLFVTAYPSAAEKLRAGQRYVPFPPASTIRVESPRNLFPRSTS